MRTGLLMSAVVIAGAVLAGSAWWYSSRTAQLEPEPQPVVLGLYGDAVASGSAPAAAVPARQVLVDSLEPGIFAGFHRWSDAERLRAIGALATQVDLDSDVVAFLMRSLSDAHISAHVRNDIANRLLALPQPDPVVAEVLVAAVNDANQPALWRDYALQHAARAIDLHRDPRVVMTLLLEKAAGSDALAGTALASLETVEATHPEVAADIARNAAGLVSNASAALPSRLTALAMIGSRGLRDQAAAVRAVAASDGEPALIRVALATLGLIGDASDLPVIERRLGDANRGIVLAAQGADTRLRAKVAL